MARKLAVNVIVHVESGTPVVMEAGSEVPKWAADQVGEHCFEHAADEGSEKPARKPRQATK